MRGARTTTVAIVTLGVLGGALPAAAGDVPGGEGYEPVFEDAPCPPEVAQDPAITCGFLAVPEDRAEPGGRRVRLFVAQLPSRSAPGAPDPVVFLAGGPGDTVDLGGFVEHPLRDGRDLILLDQRGTGRSEPSLACPEIAGDERARLALDVDDDAVVDTAAAAARACRDRLEGAGVDLSAYDSAASAADVADLRAALEIDEWNVAGHSYGSRLALTVVRDHPAGVRALALSGPYPPNADEPAGLAAGAERAFDVLFDACDADPSCQALTPDLRATVEELAARLEADPVVVDTIDAAGRPGTVRFDGDVLANALFGGLYQTALIPALPALIGQLERGEGLETIAALILDLPTFDPAQFAHGMYLSVHCQDEVALTEAGRLTRAERRIDYLQVFARIRAIERAQCEAWDVGASPRREDTAVRSPVPTLILVGEYDPTTPPADGRLAARTLPNSHFFEFPGMGHDLTLEACPRILRNRFLADPSAAPADPCLDALGPPEFGSA